MEQQHQPTDDEIDGDVEDLEDEGKSSNKSGKTFLVTAIAILVAALGLGGVSAYFLFPQAYAVMGGSAGENPEEIVPEEIVYGEFMELSGLIVNPAGTGGSRHLMVNVGLEGADEEVLALVSLKEIVVRDKILSKLAKLTMSELSNFSLRDSIKADILKDVNTLMGETPLSRLYFTAYVLQ